MSFITKGNSDHPFSKTGAAVQSDRKQINLTESIRKSPLAGHKLTKEQVSPSEDFTKGVITVSILYIVFLMCKWNSQYRMGSIFAPTVETRDEDEEAAQNSGGFLAPVSTTESVWEQRRRRNQILWRAANSSVVTLYLDAFVKWWYSDKNTRQNPLESSDWIYHAYGVPTFVFFAYNYLKYTDVSGRAFTTFGADLLVVAYLALCGLTYYDFWQVSYLPYIWRVVCAFGLVAIWNLSFAAIVGETLVGNLGIIGIAELMTVTFPCLLVLISCVGLLGYLFSWDLMMEFTKMLKI